MSEKRNEMSRRGFLGKAGAALALAAVTLLGVIGGEVLTRFIPEMILRKAAAVLFVVMGVLMWLEIL